MTTRFHFAVIESDSKFQSVRRLRDLPQLLRESLSVKRLNVVTLPQLRLTDAPQFYYAKSPLLFGPLEIMPVETVDEPLPPKPAPHPTVSKGAAGAAATEAVTKVWPTYPPIAKQWNVSGAVQVAITINENGLVIGAKATNGHPALRSAAEEAARKWVFKPTFLDGKPVKQQDVLTFIFRRPQ